MEKSSPVMYVPIEIEQSVRWICLVDSECGGGRVEHLIKNMMKNFDRFLEKRDGLIDRI